MRLTGFVLLVAAAAIVSSPASAAWKEYKYEDLGVVKEFPADPKVEKTTYKSALAKEVPATTFTVAQDDAIYQLTVVDFTARPTEGSTLMEEAAYNLSLTGPVLMNDFPRVEFGANAIYGRMLSVDEKKTGNRIMTSFFFTKGRLYIVQATILAANDDKNSPQAIRFVNSLSFNLAGEAPPAAPAAAGAAPAGGRGGAGGGRGANAGGN